MSTLRFAVATTPDLGAAAFDELHATLSERGLHIEPVFVPNYVALFETIHLHAADAAWCPPLVARDLVRVAAADPVATVLRGGLDHYYSAIVTREDGPVRRLHDLESARVGWVSRLSAAGYVVPRDFLRSFGVDLGGLDETFFHTHGRAMRALLDGAVDVIATYASSESGTFRLSPALEDARILGVAGRIPGDVVVGSRSLGPRARDLGSALRFARIARSGPLAALMNAFGFGWVPADHLRSLDRPTMVFVRDATAAHARHNPQRSPGAET